MITGVGIAVFRAAVGAHGLFGAVRRATGVAPLVEHRTAGADLPVLRFVGFPVVRVDGIVGMGITLTLEHWKRPARRCQILAPVVPRVVVVGAVID